MIKGVKVRFAPSPTGPLHIGGVRTALYNYLFAKGNKGSFILRIEDTDQTRYVKGAEEYIYDSLEWLGIVPDEGLKSEPFRQSERKPLYKKYTDQLISEGKAYYAFDTPEELEAMRDRLKAEKVVMPQYNSQVRSTMKNSLTLSEAEVNGLVKAGVPYVVRIKVPQDSEIRFQDMIRDWVSVNSSTLDDKVLMKSDGMPTYHLANVVDDHLMQISHVIRGEEWLPSAPLHVLLYEFLGWTESMPKFAHLPLLLKPEGTGKLSKRDGDKHGYPVFPMEWIDPSSGEKSLGFKEMGYLPEATVNFLALLGWNPGTEQEIFKMEELIKQFKIERINKSGAKFDIEKAKWMNQQYLKVKPEKELAEYLAADLDKEGIQASEDEIIHVADGYRDRITFPQDIFEMGSYFFIRPQEYNDNIVRKKWTEEAVTILGEYAEALIQCEDPINQEGAKNLLESILEKHGIGMGRIMQALRVAITGTGTGIDLMLTIEILGSKETGERIQLAIEKLSDFVK